MAGINLGKAYVQIVPSARNISGSISNVLSGEAISAGDMAGLNIGQALKSSLKKVLPSLSLGALVAKSLSVGGDLQQSYLGGLDTLYGEAADAAREYARVAADAGISMNNYAEQAVGFGAALKQSFKGAEDAERLAAEAANTAILDMADNAAKMGTPLESIQNAYQGFAKQNYSMLDNLRIGYGQGKEEMERLLADAEALSGVHYDIGNLADVYAAIHVIQEDIGLTGVAAEEAKTTLTGSFNAMKASAENFFGSLMLGENVVPALQSLISTTKVYLIDNLLPAIGRIFSNIPELLGAGAEMISALAAGIEKKVPELISTGLDLLKSFSKSLREKFGTFVSAGLQLVQNIVKGIVAAIPNLVKQAPEIISNFAGLINDNAPKVLEAGKNILRYLWEGVKSLVSSVKENWRSILDALLDVWEAINWINIGKNAMELLKSGIVYFKNEIPSALKNIATTAWNWFKSVNWIGLGKTVITFIWNGIKAIGSKIPTAVKSIATTAWNWFKSIDWIGLGKKVINAIWSGIKALVSQIPTAIKGIGTKAWNAFKNVDWLGLGKKIIIGIGSGIAAMVTGIPNKLLEIGEAGVEAILNIDWLGVGKKIIGGVAGFAGGIVGGIKSLGSTLWNALTGVASDAKEGTENLDWEGTGKSWMDGIINGVKARSDKVKRQTADTGTEAYNALKNRTLVQSPSKLFRDGIGKMWMEGLALGVSDNVDLVFDALDDLSSNMNDRILYAAGNNNPQNVSQNMGRKDITITNNVNVNGAEDPTAWATSLVRQMKMDMRSL